MVRLDHVLLVHVNDRLSVVLYLCKERQELREIHVSPRSGIGCGPKAFGQRLVATLGLLDSACQLTLTGQRYVVQFFRQARGEKWSVRIEQLVSSLFFASQRKRESGVHPFGALFHCLSREDAFVIFAQNGVDTSAKPRKQPNRIQSDANKQNDDGQEPEKNTPLHKRERRLTLAAISAVNIPPTPKRR